MAFQLFQPSTWFSKSEAAEPSLSEADIAALQEQLTASAPVSTDALMQAPATLPQAANENLLLDGTADKAIGKLLGSQHLHFASNPKIKTERWLKAVTIMAPDDGSYLVSASDDGFNRARLVVQFRDGTAFGDYTNESITEAVHNALRAIPVFKDKIKQVNAKAAPTFGETWKELEPVLRRHGDKFPAPDIEALRSYFAANQKRELGFGNGSYVQAAHAENKVQFTIGTGWTARIAKKDDVKQSNASSDAQITDYLKEHEGHIKAEMIKKAVALGVEGVSEESLKNLRIEVSNKPDTWGGDRLTVEFSGKDGDKLGETALRRVDTDKLAELFTDILVDETKPLPKIFSHIANNQIVGDVLRKRIGQDPYVAELLQQDAFLTPEQNKAKAKLEEDKGLITLERAVESGKDKHEFTFTLLLPKDITLQQFRESAASTLQHQVASGISHGEAAAIGA